MTIDEVLTRGVQQILPNKKNLASLMTKRKIKLYQGFDPSAPSLHLGNFVGLMKLRQFQKLGHEVIFLVGDFTGMIGDPTDKLATRKKLTREEVLENAKKWKAQAAMLLNFTGANPAKIMFNSKWLDKVTFKDLIETTSNFTVQQMMERDMFQERLKNNEPIYLHEFLYPVAQAFDSVSLEVDLEIGGNDQLFNMMAGRTLMKSTVKKEKYVLTTKLLVDKDGKKVGKTTGNALFLDSNPNEFYAGVMSFPDEVIYLAFELLTEESLSGLQEKIKENPMEEKKRLAYEIVKLLWGEKDAKASQENFVKTFSERKPDYEKAIENKGNLLDTLEKLVGSKSEVKRLINQGAVDVGGVVCSDKNYKVRKDDEIKVGERIFVKVK